MTTTFADLGVPTRIAASLAERGIDHPFPIQALTMADNLAGRDVSGRAPTGSGKTLAFGIPLVVRCLRAEPRRPRRLVLVPTRELATQVASEVKLLAGRKGPRVATFFGGTNIRSDDRVLERGVDIAVACPGRLMDLIQQRLVGLDHVEVVVLDEADRMADMGFLPQVRKLLDMCRPDRQTVLFSATLDGDVDVLVRHYQQDPVRHELDLPEEELPDLTHHFWEVERTERVAVAAQVVARTGPSVVFCRTKRGAERVAKQLANAGITAAAIHGDRSQSQRDRAIEDFRSGRAAALVATEVAARGIHVDDVAAVVHFDPPEDPKDYVHRSGRTARAGATGEVVTLVVPDKVALVKGLQKALGLPRSIGPVELELLGSSSGTEATDRLRPAVSPPANRRSRNEARRDREHDRGSERDRDRRRSAEATGSSASSGRDAHGSGPAATGPSVGRREPADGTGAADRSGAADTPRRRRHRRRHDADRRPEDRRSGDRSPNGSGTAAATRGGATTAQGRSRRGSGAQQRPDAERTRGAGSKKQTGGRRGDGDGRRSRSDGRSDGRSSGSRPSSRGPRR